MARRLIGTGITNSQGIAVMDTDPEGNPITGYTGVGAGKLQIIVESGEIVSESYDVYDCEILDRGTSTNHNDIWVIADNTSLTRNTGYSSITETGTSSALIRLNVNSRVDNTGTLEFDAYQVDGTNTLTAFYIRDSTGGTSVGSFSLSNVNEAVGEWVHIRIQFNHNKIRVYTPNTPDGYEITLSTETENYGFAFSTPEGITELRFKDFMIY